MTRPLGPGARDSDPVTSHQAAETTGRRPSQRWQLLSAVHQAHLGGTDGLTVDEATRQAGLPDVHQRWSELIDLGAIAPVRDVRGALITRPSDRGSDQRVCAITGYGLRAIFDPLLVSGSVEKRLSLVDRQIRDCTAVAEVRDLWRFYARNGTLTEDVQHKLQDRARQLLGGAQ